MRIGYSHVPEDVEVPVPDIEVQTEDDKTWCESCSASPPTQHSRFCVRLLWIPLRLLFTLLSGSVFILAVLYSTLGVYTWTAYPCLCSCTVPLPPRTSHFAVVSLSVGIAEEAYVKRSRDNKNAYAENHAFDFVELRNAPLCCPNPYFLKLLLLRNVLDHGYTAALWIDADAVVVNHTVDFRKLSPNHDLAISADHDFVINTGVFVVQNTEWSRGVLSRSCGRVPPARRYAEQSALAAELFGCPDYGLLNAVYFACHDAYVHRKVKLDWREKGADKLADTWMPRETRMHTQLLRQQQINCYHLDTPCFVVHCLHSPNDIRTKCISEGIAWEIRVHP